jgi:hypothetical protein
MYQSGNKAKGEERVCTAFARLCSADHVLDAGAGRRRLGESGQSTVELAVCLPVLLIMVLLSYNVALYLSACARFDPLAAEAVRTQAISPGGSDYGVSTRAGLVESCLESGMGNSYDVTVSVSIESISYGNLATEGSEEFAFYLLPRQERVVCTMQYRPSFIPSSIFGFSMPALTHSREFVIDPYRPGGLF